MSASMPSTPNSGTSAAFPALVQEPIKPNPHPYAIRTTSTGVLSRSNSSGRNLAASRHHYVPLPPSPTKRESKAHRPTKSLTSAPSFPSLESPKPLPVPPEFTGKSQRPMRMRAETLPAMSLTPEEFVEPVELPANPKLWTILQLSSYLRSALRATAGSGDGLPLAIVHDIASIVRGAKINGRLFLRLNEEDLESMGIDQKWREVLLTASRALRQSAIKGKIWGVDSDGSPSGVTSPNLPSHPFSSALYNSSSSSLDLSGKEDAPEQPCRRHRGRVRGMVESFERSGSFSSESSFSEGFPEDRQSFGKYIAEAGGVPEEVIRSPSPLKTTPLMCTDAVCLVSPDEPSVEELLADEADASSDADRTLWGARAWEELDLAPGVTVKRISEFATTVEPQRPGEEGLTLQAEAEQLAHGDRTTTGSARGKKRDERRVVTAIFTPNIPSREIAEVGLDVMAHPEASSTWESPQDAQTAPGAHATVTPRELALEVELAETRALVEAFKVRLEGVERELVRLQELEAQRESAHGVNSTVRTVEASATTNADEVLDASEEMHLLPSTTSCAPQSLSERASSHIAAGTSTPLPSVFQSPAADVPDKGSRGSHRDKRCRDTSEDEHENPSGLSDLPQYVFLVGFGVCAVVLQVMIRRFAGRGSGLGWR